MQIIHNAILDQEIDNFKENLQSSSLHHTNRPKRQGTQSGKYYGLEPSFQRHDHSHY